MTTRFNYYKLAHDGVKHLAEIETYLHGSGLEASLLELVKMRASQINGCAFCLDMHSKDAREAGETEQRLYGLDAWHESGFYSERERAALAWTEALTRIADTHAPDEVYAQVAKQFNEKEIADLSLAIVAINGWNRLAIGSRAKAGSYKPELAR